MSLNFGLLLAFRNPPQWRRPWADIYEEHLLQAKVAEDLGYDEIWLTEHHFWEDGWCPALLTTAAAIAARTATIRIGTFVVLLPLGKHPINVVEEATVVDIISNGRLDLGMGLGYRVPEFQGYGIPRENRAQLMDEGLEIIQRAWTEETFSFKGEYYDLKNVHLEPTPVQDPHPPIWTAVMGRKAARRAARFGFHVAGTGGENLQRMYDEELAKNNRNPADFNISQLRLAYIAPTRDQAWEDAQDHAHYMMQTYDTWLKEAGDAKWFQETMSVSNMPPPEKLRDTEGLSFFEAPLMIGTPDDIIEEIERYDAASRVTHLVLWMQLAGMDPRKTEQSMKLFAEEVLPHFRK
ncbi:MAG: LLM class flavin-dependent oxidoreductase [Gammaproteobacteria bacterium]|jgi:alkanesulfonate monooxygenase SsuD/methylene tetrahydromethanopterin reductase-like flavin-dependent oxidoreductase (luciferase family)|nr:LLM class flavin-dependent oxidoreductase [Gammaproteobacteria bacterium]